jgi:signal transduction histidine kinase
MGSYPFSSIVKRLSIDSAYGHNNIKNFSNTIRFSPATYVKKAYELDTKTLNRFLVVFFTILTLASFIVQIVLNIAYPGIIPWSSYLYFFLFCSLSTYILIITAKYDRLIFLSRYIAGFSLIILWILIVLYFPADLAKLMHYGFILIIIFSGFFGYPRAVMFTGLTAVISCPLLTILLLSGYQEPSITRLSAVILVTLSVSLITSNNRRRYRESIELEGQLKASNVQIKESDEAKGEFIAIASHNLRTPLTKLGAFFDEADRNCHGIKDETLKKLYARAKEGLIDLSVLTEGLLSISSLEEGKMKIDKKPVNLSTVIGSVVEQIRFSAEEKGIKIENHINVDVFIEGDQEKLKQAIFNIFGEFREVQQPRRAHSSRSNC